MADPCKKRVAVIGAGAAGLAAVKSCLDEGLQPACFEKSQFIGGIWHYTDEPKEGQATVFKSTTTNVSKLLFGYSDFPCPKEWPNYQPHYKVCEYLESYADNFGLRPYVQTQMDVLSVKMKDGATKAEPQWEVTVKDCGTDQIQIHDFDAVMLCIGLHRKPKTPKIPGLDNFKGEILHIHAYRDAQPFKNKSVLVVGFGDCALDVAVEISRINDKVFLSTRNGNWVLPRTGPKGLPIDLSLFDRRSNFWNNFKSFNSKNRKIEKLCERSLDPKVYNITPPWRLTQTQPCINDDLPGRVLGGYIELKPHIEEILANGVRFEDGEIQGVDTIIMGTGYDSSYSCMDERVKMTTGDNVNIYRWMFHPDVDPSIFALIGGVRVILASHLPTFELQARLATRVFKGLVKLPNSDAMKKQINQQHDEQKSTYLGNPRHRVSLEWLKYNDDIASMIGCKPNIAKLMLTKPKLGWHCWKNPCVPAQYRLTGPGAWAGACDVIMNINDHLKAPLQTRRISPTLNLEE